MQSRFAIAHLAPNLFFFALFPAFFAYHFLIAIGVLGPVLPGGGWSVTNAAGTLLLGSIVLYRLLCGGGALAVHLSVALLMAWAIAYGAYYFLWGDAVQSSSALLVETGKLVAGWGCLYCIGYLIRPDARTAHHLFNALLAMAAIVVLFLDINTVMHPHERLAGYQQFATSVLFVASFCLAFLPASKQPYVLAATLPALLLLGARSELAGFVAMSVLWTAVQVWRARWRTAVAGTCAGCVGLAVAYVAAPYLPLLQSKHIPAPASAPSSEVRTPMDRQLEVMDLSHSQSWGNRTKFLRDGVAGISGSPVAGDYGGHLRGPSGGIGNYIHNALSAWQLFGLIPFLVYCLLAAAVPVLAIRAVFFRGADGTWQWMLYVGAACLLLVIATKSVFWALPALGWGLLANALEARQPHSSVR